MNRKAVVQELVKVAKLLTAKDVEVLVYDAETERELGTITLHDYEVRHFLNSRSFPAKIALDALQINQLGIDPLDKIFFDEV